jgi:hypothetical protein
MNSFGLFAGITTSNDGSFLIVLNVFQSIKFVDDYVSNDCPSEFSILPTFASRIIYPQNVHL